MLLLKGVSRHSGWRGQAQLATNGNRSGLRDGNVNRTRWNGSDYDTANALI